MTRALFFLFLFFLLPWNASAAAKPLAFEVTGWIPYWRAATGTADILSRLDQFTAVMPFGYIVQNDGSLYDAFGFEATEATSTARVLTAVAKAQKTRVIPTVMWSNGAAIHAILSNGPKRRALEDAIAKLVKDNNFDGIDIDFEAKWAKTRPYFSLFLQGLYMRMGPKWVYCTIEPRTPPSAAYDVIPATLEYANDYSAINKYCDRVQIMAYDQGAVDIRLNAAANGSPYIPNSDVRWVEKVVTHAAKLIPKKKLLIGIPTYGYEYDVYPLTRGFRYDRVWAFNPRYALDLASSLGIAPSRNSGGEISFLYTPTTTVSNLIAAAGSAGPLPATTTPPQRIVWWSDASAISDKVQLAKKLGVRGVAIFKIDGGQDPGLWDVLPKR
ncbi:hypothetical protein HYV30_03960 [Candidatus Kaiserbacteria bacterium]|nr:hypothetical protein [Candidatus Kaiserbacteria bacterium]